MIPDSAGEPLAGGNSNAPVRFGDRVHRESGPWSPTVHAYLRHVRAHGFDLVPEPLGFDERGREVLRFLPGTVPAYPLPEVVWTDAFLMQAVDVLRRLHDASAGFDRDARVWQQPAREPDEVISVNDFAPYNLVLDGERIIGVIDLDQASPGPRTWDLAHVAYRLVPLTVPDNVDGRASTAATRGRRLRAIADGYGDVTVAAILEAVAPLLGDLATHADAHGRHDHGDLYRRDAAALERTAPAVLRAAGAFMP